MKATIVGAGLSGGVAATILKERGYQVEVFETRNFIGGNCHDHKFMDQITVHSYGPHAFHTDKKWIWDWAQKYSEFIPFQLKVTGIVKGRN
jgi:UDP-galactopyranose mutase